MPHTTPTLQLEKVQPCEFPAIREMAAQIWPLAYRGIITPEQIEFMLEQMYSTRALEREAEKEGILYDWLVRDGEKIGFIGYGPLEPGSPCLLHKFYLRTEEQGRGLGKAGMDLLIQEVAGAKEIRLRVNRENERAIRFYQNCGFEIVGEDCLSIGNGYVMDDYLMSRPCD